MNLQKHLQHEPGYSIEYTYLLGSFCFYDFAVKLYNIIVLIIFTALKIHLSEDAQNALNEFPGFHIIPRGKTSVKVKMQIESFYL